MNPIFWQSRNDLSAPTGRLLARLLSALLAFVGVPGVALACTPPVPTVDAGFYRDDVQRLPSNARGVMFFLPSTTPKASDFRISSPDDKRSIELRLDVVGNDSVFRLEPVGGFAPNARYTFEYLPTHGKWRYPDRVNVEIDDVVVDTTGQYAIELAPQPEVRMLEVPGSPACTHPVVALTQPFSYQIPAALAPYRTALEYKTTVRPEPLRGPGKQWNGEGGWPYKMVSYHATVVWPNRYMTDDFYTGADDVIAASCGHEALRGELGGRVAFPEVDDHAYRIEPVTVDLSRNVMGECRPLDALIRTMQAYGAERALNTFCRNVFGYDPDQSNAAESGAKWVRALGLLSGLSTTCTLVKLAQVIDTRQYTPDQTAMGQLGTALADGLKSARTERRRPDARPIRHDPAFLQTVDALEHLTRTLPPNLQPSAAAVIVPLLPEFAAHLADPAPYRPDAVADLIIRAGSLPADVRSQLTSIAQGKTVGAQHARAILAAHSARR